MKRFLIIATLLLLSPLFLTATSHSFNFPLGKGKFKKLNPKNGVVSIPVKKISDGKAHYFQVKSGDGLDVKFFTLKSRDNIIRAAVDACDVCYKAGKGYIQTGDFMLCENCGQRFASNRINVIKGGCNPAPLERNIVGKNLVITMDEINKNSWYCKYK